MSSFGTLGTIAPLYVYFWQIQPIYNKKKYRKDYFLLYELSKQYYLRKNKIVHAFNKLKIVYCIAAYIVHVVILSLVYNNTTQNI